MKIYTIQVDFHARGLKIPPREQPFDKEKQRLFAAGFPGERGALVPEGPPDLGEIGYYYALAQVGLEMVAPLLVGLALDYYFGWLPWATVIGTVLGFVGGFIHLISMLNRHQADKPSKPNGGTP